MACSIQHCFILFTYPYHKITNYLPTFWYTDGPRNTKIKKNLMHMSELVKDKVLFIVAAMVYLK